VAAARRPFLSANELRSLSLLSSLRAVSIETASCDIRLSTGAIGALRRKGFADKRPGERDDGSRMHYFLTPAGIEELARRRLIVGADRP
jgi:DNA-binding MarR family transcriptional regulator